MPRERTAKGRIVIPDILKSCAEGKHEDCPRTIVGSFTFMSCTCPCHYSIKEDSLPLHIPVNDLEIMVPRLDV